MKGSFLAGRDPLRLKDANRLVRHWCMQEAGQRIHGTTKQQPLVRFEQTERAVLQALPATPYELAVWKRVKLHRDGYVIFENDYYSAPFRLVGQAVWVRGSHADVKIYTADYQLAATHQRVEAGERQTHPDHLVSYKQPGVLWDAALVRAKADQIGSATRQTVELLLSTPVIDPLPTTRRVLKLAETYSPERLEAACARALVYGDTSYTLIKGILKQNLEVLPLSTSSTTPAPTAFVRSPEELLGNLAAVQL